MEVAYRSQREDMAVWGQCQRDADNLLQEAATACDGVTVAIGMLSRQGVASHCTALREAAAGSLAEVQECMQALDTVACKPYSAPLDGSVGVSRCATGSMLKGLLASTRIKLASLLALFTAETSLVAQVASVSAGGGLGSGGPGICSVGGGLSSVGGGGGGVGTRLGTPRQTVEAIV